MKFICNRCETDMKKISEAVSKAKARTNKVDIFQQCTNIVYLSYNKTIIIQIAHT